MSTLNVSNITDGTDTVGTEYVVNGSAKAWCNWVQSGTQTINDSFNVASLTDYGAGQTTLNYSNSFSNGNYSIPTSFQRSGSSGDFVQTGFNNGTTYSNVEFFSGGATSDCSKITTSINGDLA